VRIYLSDCARLYEHNTWRPTPSAHDLLQHTLEWITQTNAPCLRRCERTRMATAIVTGSGGLIGSESVERLVRDGFRVIGIENDMRARFFGASASTRWTTERLVQTHDLFESVELDIRDTAGVSDLLARHAADLELVIHTAAQRRTTGLRPTRRRTSPSTPTAR